MTVLGMRESVKINISFKMPPRTVCWESRGDFREFN